MNTKTKDLNKVFELAKELESLAHKYGYEVFRNATAEACFRASEDTEDFEDKSLTQRYRYLANCVIDAEDNEPTFSTKYIED